MDNNFKDQASPFERKKIDVMKFVRYILILLILTMNSVFLFAQENKVEMADKMRSNGRIYVVVVVVLTILAGLIIYVVRLDRKIRKLEKEN
jgi:hypothetical protein